MTNQSDQPSQQPLLPDDLSLPRNKLPVDSNESYLKTIQSLLSLVLGFATILTASGFVILNVHLSRYTTAMTYDIAPIQYLSAGLGFWFFAIVGGLYMLHVIRDITAAFNSSQDKFDTRSAQLKVALLQSKDLAKMLVKQHKYRDALRTVKYRIFARLLLIVDGIGRALIKSFRAQLVAISLYVVLGGMIWGLIYIYIPRFLGGGRPVVVEIVLKEGLDFNSMGFIQNSTYKNRTFPVIFLVNLTNGILVVDITTGKVIALRDDAILAVLDSKPFEDVLKLNISATLTAFPTTTPVITQTQTPIPSPVVTVTPTP